MALQQVGTEVWLRAQSNDDQLWQLGIDGDLTAFEEVMRRHGTAIRGYLKKLGAPGVDAQDLCQETFLRAYRFRAQYSTGSLRSWLHKLAQNVFLDWRRRTSVHPESPQSSAPEPIIENWNVVELLEREERLRWVETHARGRLSPNERIVVTHRLRGFTNKEIAAETGISAAAVRVHLCNALRKLREANGEAAQVVQRVRRDA